MNARDIALSRDALLWALGGLCQLHRVPFDAGPVLQHLPPPYSLETLIHAAHALGFKAALKAVPASAVPRLVMPCVALLKATTAGEGMQAGDGEPPPYRLALILRADQERLLLFAEGSDQPSIHSGSEFAGRYTGHLFLAIPTGAEGVEGAEPASREPFGFRWFIPELFKYRRLWVEVLAVSLVIQVIALGTPLFTQVIIDKVIAHRTVSTLAVVAVGLGIFIAFGTVLNWGGITESGVRQ